MDRKFDMFYLSRYCSAFYSMVPFYSLYPCESCSEALQLHPMRGMGRSSRTFSPRSSSSKPWGVQIVRTAGSCCSCCVPLEVRCGKKRGGTDWYLEGRLLRRIFGRSRILLLDESIICGICLGFQDSSLRVWWRSLETSWDASRSSGLLAACDHSVDSILAKVDKSNKKKFTQARASDSSYRGHWGRAGSLNREATTRAEDNQEL